ncbi:hypothetical protein EV138_3177 [Kribbella voronezhensis]|uniref:DUF222 domain-containing protein n=2 Tax=Kribbella voronezhensis TaxID=2512212 RepID=A0A4V3FKB7_9ACTN|nr:hypothetical protein EV138_3177 [Kribbella voronezhensis]
MFEANLEDLDARETLASAARLQEQRDQIDIELIEHALHFADLHPDPATLAGHTSSVPGGERGKVYGGPGCPGVAEFAPAEFGAVTGRGKVAAAHYIGQALALRHRLPETWEQVRNGRAVEWKARQIATACLSLSEDAAAIVDRRVAQIVDTLTPLRLERIVRAAKWQADPEAARAEAEEKARERGVWPGRTDDHGTTNLFVRAPTGDVIRFIATIGQIADALAALGDSDPVDQRRAKAVGIVADPALAHELLQVAQHLARAKAPATPTPAPVDPNSSAGCTPAQHDRVPRTGPDNAPAAAQNEGSIAHPEVFQNATGADASTLGPATGAGSAVAAWASEADAELEWHSEIRDESETEADRDSPHPSAPGHPLDDWSSGAPAVPCTSVPVRAQAADPAGRPHEPAPAAGMDDAAHRELAGKVAAIKQAGYRDGIGAGSRPTRTVLYVHVTDQTLYADDGVARVEGFGPALVVRLSELLGHDQIVIQPVIDLNDDTISVDAYEIPHRMRERIKLRYPVEQFPYGTAETGINTDLDHIRPYVKDGPPGQTNTSNLAPLGRLSHRIKTYGGWTATRLDGDTLEWTTRYGFKLHVTHRGTYLLHAKPTTLPDHHKPSG